METRLAGVVVLYNPGMDTINNIKTYIENVDKLYLIDNSSQNNKNYFPNDNFCKDKIEYIFNNKNKISRGLFNNWRKLNININTKNNKFYKKLYKNDCKKALIIEEICKKSYILGQLYYKVRT